MEDIVKLVLAIIAAGLGSVVAVYAVACLAAGVVAVVSGVVSTITSVAPAALCIGGAALVASKQGY